VSDFGVGVFTVVVSVGDFDCYLRGGKVQPTNDPPTIEPPTNTTTPPTKKSTTNTPTSKKATTNKQLITNVPKIIFFRSPTKERTNKKQTANQQETNSQPSPNEQPTTILVPVLFWRTTNERPNTKRTRRLLLQVVPSTRADATSGLLLVARTGSIVLDLASWFLVSTPVVLILWSMSGVQRFVAVVFFTEAITTANFFDVAAAVAIDDDDATNTSVVFDAVPLVLPRTNNFGRNGIIHTFDGVFVAAQTASTVTTGYKRPVILKK
jgi:hypothetical protein